MKSWLLMLLPLGLWAQQRQPACLYIPTQDMAQHIVYHSSTQEQHLTADGRTAQDIPAHVRTQYSFDTLLVHTYWVQQAEDSSHNMALVLRHYLRERRIHISLSSRYAYRVPVDELRYAAPAAYFSENEQSRAVRSLFHDIFVEMDAEGYPHLKELLLHTPSGRVAWLVLEGCR